MSSPNNAAERIAPGRKRPTDGRSEWGKQATNWPDCLTNPPALPLPNFRREWVEAGLALAGGILGWLTPLLLQQVEYAPGVNFYHCGEDILCPLFACFGAGLGLMIGVLQGTSRPRGVVNGQRTVAP